MGSQCSSCGHVQLEAFACCPSCLIGEESRVDFGTSARLYSFSVLRTGPVPQGLGYADLPNGARTFVVLEPPFDPYACDMAVTLEQRADVIVARPVTAHA